MRLNCLTDDAKHHFYVVFATTWFALGCVNGCVPGVPSFSVDNDERDLKDEIDQGPDEIETGPDEIEAGPLPEGPSPELPPGVHTDNLALPKTESEPAMDPGLCDDPLEFDGTGCILSYACREDECCGRGSTGLSGTWFYVGTLEVPESSAESEAITVCDGQNIICKETATTPFQNFLGVIFASYKPSGEYSLNLALSSKMQSELALYLFIPDFKPCPGDEFEMFLVPAIVSDVCPLETCGGQIAEWFLDENGDPLLWIGRGFMGDDYNIRLLPDQSPVELVFPVSVGNGEVLARALVTTVDLPFYPGGLSVPCGNIDIWSTEAGSLQTTKAAVLALETKQAQMANTAALTFHSSSTTTTQMARSAVGSSKSEGYSTSVSVVEGDKVVSPLKKASIAGGLIGGVLDLQWMEPVWAPALDWLCDGCDIKSVMARLTVPGLQGDVYGNGEPACSQGSSCELLSFSLLLSATAGSAPVCR